MSEDEVLSRLLETSRDFLVSLRSGSGFEEAQFEELCRSLKECAEYWRHSSSIPKDVANVLIDLWPGIQNCGTFYSSDEASRILKAADTIGALSRDIVTTTSFEPEPLWRDNDMR